MLEVAGVIAPMALSLFVLHRLFIVQDKLQQFIETVNDSTLKEMAGTMEPGVYLPRTNPITKETTYVKAKDLSDPDSSNPAFWNIDPVDNPIDLLESQNAAR